VCKCRADSAINANQERPTSSLYLIGGFGVLRLVLQKGDEQGLGSQTRGGNVLVVWGRVVIPTNFNWVGLKRDGRGSQCALTCAMGGVDGHNKSQKSKQGVVTGQKKKKKDGIIWRCRKCKSTVPKGFLSGRPTQKKHQRGGFRQIIGNQKGLYLLQMNYKSSPL